MTWHVAQETLTGYVDGTVDAVAGSSVEQHLVQCADCRAEVGRLVGPVAEDPVLSRAWDGMLDRVEAPRPTLVERLLVRLGVAAEDALLLGTAPAFRTPWLAATLASVFFAALAAASADSRGMLLYLLVAPLIPVAGVALAYGPDADETWELGVAAPYSSVRLLLLRTVAVLVTTLPVIVGVGLLLPGQTPAAVAWLAPSLAGVALTLAAATWVSPGHAAVGVSCAWVALIAALSGPAFSMPWLVLAPERLPAYLAVAVVSGLVLRARIGRLHHLGGTS